MTRRRLHWVQLPDGRCELGWYANGLATFPYGHAPEGLATRRQLRARGLCPGGHPPVAQLVWRGGKRWAGLYRTDLATPTRTPTLRQRVALRRAMTARHTCRSCQQVKPYEVSKPHRQCFDCLAVETTDTAA